MIEDDDRPGSYPPGSYPPEPYQPGFPPPADERAWWEDGRPGSASHPGPPVADPGGWRDDGYFVPGGPGNPDGLALPGRPVEPNPRRRSTRVLVGVTVFLLLVLAGALIVPRLGGSPDRPAAAALPSPTAAAAAPVPSPTAAPSPTAPHSPTRPRLVLARTLTAAGPAPSLPWPSSGQAQVEIAGLGPLGHSGSGHAVQIASVAKVMTAYTVLRDHPLGSGQAGPSLTVSAAEAAAYPAQKADQESVVVVAAGEKLSERDALKGLLIASGDNMAQILARWDAGSVPGFVQRMNRNAGRLGMASSHYADPAGLDPGTVSTAADLLRLAPVAMAQPTLAALVGTSSSSMPLNPRITNYNSLLGTHGVIGIKTGTTTSAGGCLLFAARHSAGGHTVTIYGAVLGISGDRSSILSNARDAGDALVVGAGSAVHAITLIHANQPVVTLYGKSGAPVTLGVAKDVQVTGWSGQHFRFALPGGLRSGQAPRSLVVHTPTRTFTVRLVRQ